MFLSKYLPQANSVSQFFVKIKHHFPRPTKFLNKFHPYYSIHPKYSYGSFQAQQQSQQLYDERACTPFFMSKMLIQQLSSSSQSVILHQISLYHSKIIPFDYDYYCQSLKKLIDFQEKLSLDELIMLFDLAIEYKIDNIVLEAHFQNQLFCKLHLGLKKEISDYDRAVSNQLKKTIQTLQAGSDDHFFIINDKFKKLFAESMQKDDLEEGSLNEDQTSFLMKFSESTQQMSLKQPVYHASQRKSRSKNTSPAQLNKITKIFLDSNSKSIEFNKLLLEIHTVRLDESFNTSQSKRVQLMPEYLINYTRLSINLLQLYLREYLSNLQTKSNQPSMYTHRSIKRIYKLQTFYYYEIAKLIEQKNILEHASNQELMHFLNSISAFSIKRRSLRKSIGDALIRQTKKRKMNPQQLLHFFELSKYDNKLLQHFQNQINKSPDHQSHGSQSTEIASEQLKVPSLISEISQDDSFTVFEMPSFLFRQVTKKKSKQKKKQLKSEQQFDLTEPDEAKSQAQKPVKQSSEQTAFQQK